MSCRATMLAWLPFSADDWKVSFVPGVILPVFVTVSAVLAGTV